jgi:diguanylate cyclase (GGDEF)-like protein
MSPVSIVMLDMDSLKKVNDTFGHAVGDMSLRILVNRLRQMIRANAGYSGRQLDYTQVSHNFFTTL